MTLDELKARLEGLEWTDIEFKEAAWQVPRDIYEIVLAFSNICEGWPEWKAFLAPVTAIRDGNLMPARLRSAVQTHFRLDP